MDEKLYHLCRRADSFEEFKQILEDHPEINVNYIGANYRSILSNACYYGRSDIVRLLLDHPDIDPNLGTHHAHTPLIIACIHGKHEVVKILIKDIRIDINRCQYGNQTPLWMASYWNNYTTVKYLLSTQIHEIDTTITSDAGSTAKDVARRVNNNLEVVRLLDEYEADPIKTKGRLRRELFPEEEAIHLFSMMLLVYHGYLRIKK